MGSLAVLGGTAVRTKPFPGWPVFDETEVERVVEVVRSGAWWYGENVRRFEEEYAAFHGAAYGVTCTNGTAALEIALQACAIQRGDEVIVPPYTFVATASAVMRTGGIPVFADIDLATANLDIHDVRAKLTPRTKAVIPVHFGGLPVDMDAYNALAAERGLSIIEDACHSWGTQWKGKGTGALGACGAFSFQMSKNITAGEGGIMLTDHEEIADAARSVTNCGRGKEGSWYEHVLVGTNLRMTEIQAAILRVQLTRLEEQTLKRQHNARILNARLSRVPGIRLVEWEDPRITRRSYHIYFFRFIQEEWDGVSRARFLEALNAEGVPAFAGYPIPLYENPMFRNPSLPMDYSAVDCPNTKRMCAEGCWIMHHALLGDESDMDDIATAVEKVREHSSTL